MIFQNKKAIIFDLDGTLANTLSAITEAVNMTMSHYSLSKKSEDEVRRAIGSGAKMLIKRLIPVEWAADERLLSEIADHYGNMYALTYLHTTENYDGITELVKDLRKKEIKIAVLSNKQDAYVKGLVKLLFPDGEVSIARGQTELPVKPDPAGVRAIMDELSVSSDECIFVGDSGVDLKTAENCGMDSILVSWGFCGREALQSFGAKCIVDVPNEIIKMLK